MGLGELLEQAGVSRTAYYSLARKDSILPKSIVQIARALNVPAGKLVEDDEALRNEMLRMAEEAADIAEHRGGVNAENVRHTLILLRHEPIERLRKALIRAS